MQLVSGAARFGLRSQLPARLFEKGYNPDIAPIYYSIVSVLFSIIHI